MAAAAHNSYIRDTPQLPLPDTTRPIVDLFAAETGALLALTRYLLPDELDTAASGITARMERELNARILTPYFTSHFWWMGNGAEPMCNWTSWCTQNVLLTVFLLPTTQQQRQAAVKQAAYSLDCFLKDYGADGCCNEGAQYYRHAGLTLWGCLEILSSIVPEAFSPLFHEPKIKNIAEYICNVHVEGPYYLNFGDCSPLPGGAVRGNTALGRLWAAMPCKPSRAAYSAPGSCCTPSKVGRLRHALCMVQISVPLGAEGLLGVALHSDIDEKRSSVLVHGNAAGIVVVVAVAVGAELCTQHPAALPCGIDAHTGVPHR